MTTIVTVTTGDHPAAILGFPLKNGEPIGGEAYQQLAVLSPHSTYDVAATADQDILVRELVADGAVPEAAAAEVEPEPEAA